MATALGIISYTDSSIYVRGLSKFRPVAAYSYVGRYRLVDIPISNMANSGIDNIDVYTNGDPKVLFDHVGSARHYNINNKHGHVGVIPVFADGERVEYITDLESYYKNLYNIMEDPNPYVVMAPVNFVFKQNFADLLNEHINSGADVTALYYDIDNADEVMRNVNAFEINRQHGVKSVYKNQCTDKNAHISLETFVMSKKIFKEIVTKGHEFSSLYWFMDMLNVMASDLDIRAVEYTSPVFPIYDYNSYYTANMNMLNEENMSFFNNHNWPIYTRTNDSPPTIYQDGGSAQGALISNGCVIKGKVSNSIIGRNVVIEEGAIVADSLILPGVKIGPDSLVTCCIIDKDAKVINKKELTGYIGNPLYIARREIV